MKIVLAKHAGFCFGVRRAVTIAIKTAKDYKGKNIYTFGSLIHNPQVISALQEKGIQNCSEIRTFKDDVVIIPSHGMHPSVIKDLRKSKSAIIDATCPFVNKIERIVTEERKKKSYIIIVGDKDHPEVAAISGYAGKRSKIVESVEEAKKVGFYKKLAVVAQTTQGIEKYKQISEILRKKAKEVKIYSTICDATEKRQKEALELAHAADRVIVVGGFSSANTKRLVELCKQLSRPTLHVEEARQVTKDFLKNGKNICILAGASTPDWIIHKVVQKIKMEGKGTYGNES